MPEIPTSNKWLWIGGAAIGAYFIYDYFKTQANPPLSPLGQQLNAQTEGASLVLPAPTKTVLTTTVHNAIDPTVGTTVTVPVVTTVNTLTKTPVAVGGSTNVPTTTPTTAPLSSNTPIKGTTSVIAPTQVVNPAIKQVPPAQTGGTATVIPLRPPSATNLAPGLGQSMYKNTGPQGGAGSVAAQYIDPTQSAAVSAVVDYFPNVSISIPGPVYAPVTNLSSLAPASNYTGETFASSTDMYGITSVPEGTVTIGNFQSADTNTYYTGENNDPLNTVVNTSSSPVISNYMNPVVSVNNIDILNPVIEIQSVFQGTTILASTNAVYSGANVTSSAPAQSTPIYDFSSSNVAGSIVFAGGGSGWNVNYNSDSGF